MKVSIITAAYNSEKTLRDTIVSVLSQDYPDIEYIVVDGASNDQTGEIVRSFGDQIAQFVSEPDRGMYDAMNKGIALATGDVIGILNSDDFYADATVISSVVDRLQATQADAVFGDLVYVNDSDLSKVTRYYSSARFQPRLFAYGWMPAHPTFFVKRWAYEQYGVFQIDYKIAADYELLTRFLAKYHLAYAYIPQVMVRMRTGGASTTNLMSNWILNREILRACAENGIKTNWFKVLSKYFTKVFQLIRRPKPAALSREPALPFKS
ncbi:glycosyltransferase [filamentous cyanobacterium LEGE 11480]|uniref:Glycosyltransferase n=1 Tax=Romeriopsis navalis LEGE 11480 TaxID=2777977 RepID=A0A928VLV8_9CYAN|nr:glycosyltransferase family 2 protein [Romeriopsis navalis]MBE9028900.1 glycosyltransferase [Romeriopsis navalis LEGE 11480]